MAEVTTSGSGEVEREPDRAEVSVGYSAPGGDRSVATTALTRKIEPVERVLARAGLEVRSRDLRVHSVWDHGRRSRKATAQQSYRLRVTDLAMLDDLLAELLATEPAHLSGPDWQLADRVAAAREAQRRSVLDARDRATGLATALGQRLGDLVRISDESSGGGMAYAAMMRGGGPGGPPDVGALNLRPEPVTVHASCTATWLLD